MSGSEKDVVRDINSVLASAHDPLSSLKEVPGLISDLVDQLHACERKLRISNDKLVELELAGVSSSSEAVSAARVMHADLQRREAQIHLLTLERDGAVAEVDRLSSQVERIRNEESHALAALGSDLASLIQEKEHLQSQLDVRDRRIRELQSMLEEGRAELTQTKHELLNRTNESNDMKRELRSVELELKARSDTVKSLENQNRLLNRETHLRGDLESELAKLRSETAKKGLLLDERDHLIKTVNARSLVSVQDKVEVSRYQDELAKQRRLISELETEVKSAKAQIDHLNTKLKESELALGKKDEKIHSLEKKNDEIQERLNKSDLIVKSLEKQKDTLLASVEELEKDTSSLQNVVQGVRVQLDDLRQERNLLRQQLDEALGLEDELGAIVSQLEESKMRSDHARREVVELRAKLDVSEDEMRMHARESEKFRNERDALMQAFRKVQLEMGTDETIEHLRSVQEEVSALELNRGAMESELVELQKELSSIRKKLLEGDSGSSRKALEEAQTREASARKALEAAQSRDAVARKALEAAQETIKNLKEENMQLQATLIEREQSPTPVLEAEAILLEDEKNSEAVVHADDIEAAAAELRTIIEEAGWPLDEGEDLLSLIAVIRANMHAHMEYLGSQLHEAELDVEYLRTQLETERMAFEDANATFEDELKRSAQAVMEETGKRRIIQDSALELAEKTKAFWSKYKTDPKKNLPPFSRTLN